MPTKNTLKIYAPDSYYHVYNRGWNRGEIFLEEEDYAYFEWLLARSLSEEEIMVGTRPCKNFRESLSLNAYCLMPNHFHLLIFQREEDAMARFVKSLGAAYTAYFNKKYKRRGGLFESRYKAVLIQRDNQLQHITRYIHLNHKAFRTWPHSSYQDYLGDARPWLTTQPILELFNNRNAYKQFVDDYEDMQRSLEQIKRELAGDLTY